METEEEIYNVHVVRDQKTGIAVGEAWSAPKPRPGYPADEELWRRHRLDGPALISRDRNTGVIVHEVWCNYGRRHRLDGPAVVRRDGVTGKIKFSAWYNDGALIPSRQRAKESRSLRPAALTDEGPSL